MARLTAKGISGLVGNVVFYTVDGTTFVRSKGVKKITGKRKKKDPLKEAFGIVSKFGSGMTKLLKPYVRFPFRLPTYNRVRGWMRNVYLEYNEAVVWDFSGQQNGMCQLNGEIDLRDFFKTNITVTDTGNGSLKVTIPALHPKREIKAPLRTMKVNIQLVAVTCSFQDEAEPYSVCSQQVSLAYNDQVLAPKMVSLKTVGKAGHIAFVAMSMEYETQESAGKIVTEIRWLPAAIVAIGRLK